MMVQKLSELLKNSKSILLQMHRKPDLDSASSVLAWKEILGSQLNKSVDIVCPTVIPSTVTRVFPEITQVVKTEIDYAEVDFSKYDLWILNDISSTQQLGVKEDFTLPDIPIFLIDHHSIDNLSSNNRFSDDNKMIDFSAISTTQIIYKLFNELKLNITPQIATYLLAGMITSDSLFMKAQNLNAEFFLTIGELIAIGGDRNMVIKNSVYKNRESTLNAVGYLLQKIKISEYKKHKFAYCFLSFEEFEKLGSPDDVKDIIADEYIGTIEETDFGIILIETVKGKIGIGIRSRNENFDSGKLANLLGGGGHKSRAGGVTTREKISEILGI